MSSPLSSPRSSIDSFNSETPLLESVNKAENAQPAISVEGSKESIGTKIPTSITVEKEVNKHLERLKKVMGGVARVAGVVASIPVGILAYTAGYLLMTLFWAGINFLPTPMKNGEVNEQSMLYGLQVDMGGVYIKLVDGLLRTLIGMKDKDVDKIENKDKDETKTISQNQDPNFEVNEELENFDIDGTNYLHSSSRQVELESYNAEDDDVEDSDDYGADSVRSSSSQVDLDSLSYDADDAISLDDDFQEENLIEKNDDVALEELGSEDDMKSELDVDADNQKRV